MRSLGKAKWHARKMSEGRVINHHATLLFYGMCGAGFVATEILWKLFKDNLVQFQTFELSLDGCYSVLFV